MTTSIYLVDDHTVMRDGLRAFLKEAGYDPVGDSGDVTQALADLSRLRPDVAVIDLNLVERSGLELLTELKRRQLPVRSIMLTMSMQPRHVAHALRLGALGYVLKGSPSSELINAIEAVSAGRRYLGSGVADLATQALIAPDHEDPFALLSPREHQIVIMVANGRTSAAIGEQLHLSPKTVDTYRSRLMEKLNVADLASLVKLALKHHIVEND